MQSTPSFDLDDTLSKGILLIVVLFFSWFIGLKNLVLDWTSAEKETQSPISPNVLMIVVDDLGYDDTSAIHSDGLPTPNITALAQRGVTFRRHYADSTCTPSRVALLTGRYPERSGFRPIGTGIPAEFATLAEQFQEAGYTTYLTGKWHAGEEGALARPENKGFENWFGFLNQFELSGEITESGPKRKPTYHDPMLRENGGILKQYPGHLTDILTAHTLKKLEQLQAQGKPWFLYHAFLAPHNPIQPASRYKQRFPDTPEGQYTALVTQLDDAIGKILEAVDRKNTLVVFVSDNGGTNRQRNNNFPYYGAKNQPLEGAYRTPMIVSWPEVLPTGKFIDDVVMNVDIYPTVLQAAHATAPADIDGKSLWDLMLNDIPLAKRSRSWEGYHPNINTFSYSLLSDSGQWRQSSRQGVVPHLFDLSQTPSADIDVATDHVEIVNKLTAEYWQSHWEKSLLAVAQQPGRTTGQTLYSGFDAMRTPSLYGFAIGLEIGPLTTTDSSTFAGETLLLAGQKDRWELHYRPDHGLEWHMGNAVLKDSNFNPARCNAIILTGYFQPVAHLAQASTRSPVKLYSSGFLRDSVFDLEIGPANANVQGNPTFVNAHGKAKFTSVMLSSFSDSYSPRTDTQFAETMNALYRQKKLAIADVAMMDHQLCK